MKQKIDIENSKNPTEFDFGKTNKFQEKEKKINIKREKQRRLKKTIRMIKGLFTNAEDVFLEDDFMKNYCPQKLMIYMKWGKKT